MGQNRLENENEKLKEVLLATKRLNKELLETQEKQDSLDFAWSGNLGYWYWDIGIRILRSIVLPSIR